MSTLCDILYLSLKLIQLKFPVTVKKQPMSTDSQLQVPSCCQKCEHVKINNVSVNIWRFLYRYLTDIAYGRMKTKEAQIQFHLATTSLLNLAILNGPAKKT